MSSLLRAAAAALLCLSITGCPGAKRPPVTRSEDAMREAMKPPRLLDDADLPSLRAALGESLVWIDALPADRRFVYGPRVLSTAEVRLVFTTMREILVDDPSPDVLEKRIHERFDILESTGGESGDVLYTGYYEPVIEAAAAPDATYATPVYARPPDLVEIPIDQFGERFAGERGLFGRIDGAESPRPRVLPYWSRTEIAAGKLAGKNLELAWAKDPIALFFVEVQGSGALVFPDGTEKRIGYAASNGRLYQSIGKLLIDEGQIPREQMSMQALRAWLLANPSEITRVFAYNPSYVFFRMLDGAPLGSLGRPVTPGRSVATDSKLFPHGALAFISTARPIPGPDGKPEPQKLGRFVLNQDTGGAIRGAGRVDVFWGRGPDAEYSAGHMKERGRLFFLVPKRVGPASP